MVKVTFKDGSVELVPECFLDSCLKKKPFKCFERLDDVKCTEKYNIINLKDNHKKGGK